jgi:hypothetical protein
MVVYFCNMLSDVGSYVVTAVKASPFTISYEICWAGRDSLWLDI